MRVVPWLALAGVLTTTSGAAAQEAAEPAADAVDDGEEAAPDELGGSEASAPGVQPESVVDGEANAPATEREPEPPPPPGPGHAPPAPPVDAQDEAPPSLAPSDGDEDDLEAWRERRRQRRDGGDQAVPDDEPPFDWGEAGAVAGSAAAGIAAGFCAAFVGTFCICWPLIPASPCIHGFVTTWVADSFGGARAALVWPILAAYGGLVAAIAVVSLLAGVAAAVFWVVGLLGGAVYALATRDPRASPPDVANAVGGIAAAVVALVGIVPGLAAVWAAPGVAYFVASRPKDPEDRGEGMPGILVPSSGGVTPSAPERRAFAMAF